MPRASPSYCRKTSIKKMGFSQKASCKAQGLIKRTSKKIKVNISSLQNTKKKTFKKSRK